MRYAVTKQQSRMFDTPNSLAFLTGCAAAACTVSAFPLLCTLCLPSSSGQFAGLQCRPANVIPVLHLTSPDLAQHPAEGQHTLSTANFSKQWTQSVQQVCCTTKRVPATVHIKQNERMCACKCTCIVDKLGLITSTVVDMLANESLTALSCAAMFGTFMSATLKASALTGGLELCGSGDVGGDPAGVESADVSLSDPTTDFSVLCTRPMPVISLGNSSTTLCRVLRVSPGLLDSGSWLCSTSMLSEFPYSYGSFVINTRQPVTTCSRQLAALLGDVLRGLLLRYISILSADQAVQLQARCFDMSSGLHHYRAYASMQYCTSATSKEA